MNPLSQATLPSPSDSATKPLLGPSIAATSLLCIVLLLNFLFLEGDSAYEVANLAAISIGLAIAAGLIFEGKRGLKNLFRIDLLCIVGLYGLTLAEFLFEQPSLNHYLNSDQVKKGLQLIFLGFGSLAIGRHLVRSHISAESVNLSLPTISPPLLTFFTICAFLVGHLFMFIAVNFNPFELFENLIGPRFASPWGRGRYGNFSTLLNEFNLIVYIIPPIAGYALVNRKNFSKIQLLTILLSLLFILFVSFARVTRNVLAIHLATFSIGFIFSQKQLKIIPLALLSVTILASFLFSSYHMLEFRNMGLKRYLEGGYYSSESTRDTLFIDFNLLPISQLAERFPGEYRYLGWEVPYWALIKPIPRAFWPDKPKGLSIGIEQALGQDQATVAVTFIGESFMAAGKAGIIMAGLFFGALCSWWNRIAASGGGSLSIILYAVGFYGGMISMRSLFWLTTAALPAIALLIFAKFFVPRFFPSLAGNQTPNLPNKNASNLSRA